MRNKNSYRIRNALPPSQDKQVRFKVQDDEVYNWPQF